MCFSYAIRLFWYVLQRQKWDEGLNKFVVFLPCVCYAFYGSLLTCALWSPAGKRLTSWLSFVVHDCEFVTFPLESWVRCGT